MRMYTIHEYGPISWTQSYNNARAKGGALGTEEQLRYITARRSGKTSYVESQFTAEPLRDTGAWGLQNDKKDLWAAIGADVRLK